MDIVYTLDVLSAAPSGGVPLQDLGIRANVPKWSNPPTNTILTVGYSLSALGITHEEVEISKMLSDAIIAGHIALYGDGVLLQDNNYQLVFTGNASQYVRGDGSLGNFPTSFGTGGGGVSYYLNGGVAANVATYYEMSKIANLGANADFPKVGNGLITQFITDVGQPNIVEIPGGNWSCGIYVSMSANGGTPAIYLELFKYDGSNFTLIATSPNEVITGGVLIDLYTVTIPVPTTALLTTDRLAIRVHAVNSAGKTTTVHTQDGHLCEISTTFSTGISAINSLVSPTQYLTTGTAGTNFGISSLGETHTFNLPVASATNTGKLTSTDWTTFNNKQAALGFTPENIANKGVANGYAPLDATTKIPATYLPSYVDDVEEYANLGTFPGTGETGKIYIAIDTGKTYRWTGSVYVEISTSNAGTVTSVSVVSANGFAGSVATPTSTPAITISTSVTGVLKGNGTAISAASPGTDYVAPNAPITGSTNTKITYDSKGLVTAGASAILASADFANQGTVTTLLHGNASGNPSFAPASLTADVSGVLPIINGGTNSSTALNNNRVIISSAGSLVESPALTNGQLLIGSTGVAPVPSTLTQGAGVTITTGAGSVTIRKTVLDNLSGTADPTVTDDSNSGYSVGSTWINTVTKKAFICLDATVGSAVWGAATTTGGASVSPTFTSSYAADNKNYIASPNMNANSTWFTIAQMIFPGTVKFGGVSEVYFNIWRISGTAPYEIRLFDSTSSLTVCTSGSQNSISSTNIITVTGIANLPTAPTIFLIQSQRLASNNTTLGLGSITLVG